MDRRVFLGTAFALVAVPSSAFAGIFCRRRRRSTCPPCSVISYRSLACQPYRHLIDDPLRLVTTAEYDKQFVDRAYRYTLPANTGLRFTVDVCADKENGIKFSIVDSTFRWIRNSYEVVCGTPYEVTLDPIQSERKLLFEAMSKDCYLGNNCSRRPWYSDYGPVMQMETDTFKHMWWDDSRDPPQYRNVELKIYIG